MTTIIGTLGNCFNNFQHFAIIPEFSIFFLFLFGKALVKLKHIMSAKTIYGSLKYQYSAQRAFKSAIFLCEYKV